MADVNIGAKITVDSAQSTKSIAEMQGEIKKLSQELRNAKIGSDEYKEASTKLAAAQKELSASTGEKVKSFDALKTSIRSTIPALDGASSGVSSFGKQLWALAANPIVLILTAIVGALTLLYKAFTMTDAGAQKIQAIFDGIGAVVRELTQRLNTFASAVSKVMQGDFKGAMEDAKASVNGLGDAMVESFQRGRDASNMLDEVADAVRVLDLQYAAMNARLSKSREILTDENASYRDKKKALAESGEDIEKYYKKLAEVDTKRIDGLAKKYNIEKQIDDARKKGFEVSAEDLDNYLQTLAIGEDGIKEIEGAIKQSIKSSDDYKSKQRAQNKADNKLDREAQAKQRELDAQRKKDLEEQKKAEDELRLAHQKRMLSMKDATLVTSKDIRDQEAEEKKKAQKKAEDEDNALLERQKKVIANRTGALVQELADRDNLRKQDLLNEELAYQAKEELLRLSAEGLSAFSQLAGENTAVGKALAVASTTISTYSAAQAAFEGQLMIKDPSAPFRAALAAGVAIASGLARVKGILSVNVPGGGSGGSVPSIGASGNNPAPLSPPPVASTTINQRQINQIGNATARAFVLESDITNNRERLTRITRAARIG